MTAIHPGRLETERATPKSGPIIRRLLRILGSILFAIFAALLVAGAVVVNVQHLKLEPVLSGSMRPEIQPGDLAVVRPVPVSELHAGEVIAYLPPQHTIPVLHRIVEISAAGVITKGDANPVADPWGRVKPQAASVDRLVTVIPKVGFLLDVRPLLLKIFFGILIVALATAAWASLRTGRKTNNADNSAPEFSDITPEPKEQEPDTETDFVEPPEPLAPSRER